MIVSMAMAVLPVERSPMISSRWPRPTGNHGVNRLDAGLHRLVDGLPCYDVWRDSLQRAEPRGLDGAFAVDGNAERVYNAAQHGVANRHLSDAARRPNLGALLDAGRLYPE